MAPVAENLACGSTQESLIISLIESFNQSFSKCHLETCCLPAIMLSAGETTLPYEDFSLVGEKTSHYNIG